jgi:lysophospholipase L1-like esterase
MNEALEPEQVAYFTQFIHPDKGYDYLPGADANLMATMLGVEPAAYQAVASHFAANAAQVAAELLRDPEFAGAVDRVPFAPGSTIVGLADSITDDLQSWFEMLRHALTLRRPGDNFRLHNQAVSGDTTTALISRFYGVTQLNPDWILCMVGTNDAREHGLSPGKTLVSLGETGANLREVRAFAARQTSARWVWLTPTPVIESRIPQDWWLGPQQMMWRNANLRPIVELIRAQDDPVVDLWSAFGEQPPDRYLLSDGLHPSLEGQTAILRSVVERLTHIDA